MKTRKPRVRNFETVAVRLCDGAELVLGTYTTVRAALSAMLFRAAFGRNGIAWRVRDVRTGAVVSELVR